MRTIPYSEPWHIRTRGLLKPCETLTRHIQNLRQCLHMQKLDTLAILECSELFRNCIPHIHREYLKYSTYLISNTFLEPFQRFKMEILAKIVQNYIYFSKVLILRSLTKSWISLSLNKYSTCRVNSHYLLYDTYSLVNSNIFRPIQAYSAIL